MGQEQDQSVVSAETARKSASADEDESRLGAASAARDHGDVVGVVDVGADADVVGDGGASSFDVEDGGPIPCAGLGSGSMRPNGRAK